jgi:hypothetical protein
MIIKRQAADFQPGIRAHPEMSCRTAHNYALLFLFIKKEFASFGGI